MTVESQIFQPKFLYQRSDCFQGDVDSFLTHTTVALTGMRTNSTWEQSFTSLAVCSIYCICVY